MKLINKYIEVKFWQILLLGGAIVASMVIIFMILGFFIAVFSDYGRVFSFSLSTFIGCLYGFAVLLYFPIKFLLKLKKLKETIELV